jgi:hypothetical protein
LIPGSILRTGENQGKCYGLCPLPRGRKPLTEDFDVDGDGYIDIGIRELGSLGLGSGSGNGELACGSKELGVKIPPGVARYEIVAIRVKRFSIK